MNSLTKSQHLKFYLKLKQQEGIIEKSIEAFMVNSKVDVEDWYGIKQDIDKFENDRQNIVALLKSKVTNIYEELKSVRSTFNAENVGTIDLPVFKTKLQSLWKNIEEFKNSHNATNILVEEENSIKNDLSTLTRAIRKHKNFASIDHQFYKTTISNNRQSHKDDSTKECDYEQAEDFCSLLAKTGHTGSWSEEDHLLFVNLRKRHRSVASLVHAVQAKCPDLTKESIVNHESWYKTYLDLREKQKLAVQQWRERKESERQTKLATKTSEEPVLSICKISDHKKAEVEKKKELVRKWKEEKEKQRIADEERLRNHLKARREMRENRRKARAERLKSLVEEYKKRKVIKEEEVASEIEKEQAAMNALNLKFYRAKDQEFVQKRRFVLSSKKTTIEPKPVECNFNRVYCESTLLKETKAWQEKMRKSDPVAINSSLSYIKDLPKRTLVSWKSYEIPGSFTSRQR